jgi:ADP-ribose pyrophosphatase YjhB (NUDIX family)
LVALTELRQQLYLMADEMRGMATLGKYFSANVYETERAAHIMAMAAQLVALAEGDIAPEHVTQIKTAFESDKIFHISPANSVEAAVFNPQGEILLIQRKDNGKWALPGGIAEIGHSLPEMALRELWEEAGVRGQVTRLLALFDARQWSTFFKFHLMHFVFHVTCDDYTPAPGIESLDARYFAPDALPISNDMHGSHWKRVPVCVEMWRSGQVYSDPADSRTSDMPMQQRPQ